MTYVPSTNDYALFEVASPTAFHLFDGVRRNEDDGMPLFTRFVDDTGGDPFDDVETANPSRVPRDCDDLRGYFLSAI